MRKLKRILSVITVGVLLLQLSVVAFSASETDFTADYSGRILAAINTDLDDEAYSFSAQSIDGDNSAAQELYGEAEDSQGESGGFLDAVVDNIEPLSPHEAKRRSAAGSNSENIVTADYHVGDRKSIYSSDVIESEINSFGMVELTCVYTGTNCTVWCSSENSKERYKCVRLGEDFDLKFPELIELFGDRRIDTDRDGKIALFLYKLKSFSGYFSSSDLIDTSGKIGNVSFDYSSNACDCVHIDLKNDLKTVCSTAAHEYQHYVSASYCYYGKDNTDCLYGISGEINEAFSTAAQYIICDDSSKSSSFYSAAQCPDENSLLHWRSNVNYSLSFVFGQYIRTRYAQLIGDTQGDKPGKGIYKKVLESITRDNQANILGVIADLLYPEADYPQLKDTVTRSKQLITDFWIAVYCRDKSGVHGFNDDRISEYIPIPYVSPSLPGEGSVNICSGMAAFYLINGGDTGTAKVTDNEEQLIFVGINRDGSSGYTLTYDRNSSGYMPQPEGLITTTRLSNDVSRHGYTLMGWALSPDAETAEYRCGETITLSHDTTLYAVWERGLEMAVDTVYTRTVTEYYNKFGFIFVPETSGFYTFSSVNADISADDLYPVHYLNPYVEYGLNSTDITYELAAGRTYYIVASGHNDEDEKELTLSVSREPLSYTLSFDSNESDNNRQELYRGKDVYRINEFSEFSRVGYSQTGWSRDKNADVAEYVRGDYITLTEDTVLYAVWKPIAALEEGVKVGISADSNNGFLFTPKSDGTFCLDLDESPEGSNVEWYCLLQMTSTPRFSELLHDNDKVFLRGGSEYVVYAYAYATTGDETLNTSVSNLTITRVSDKMACTLRFEMFKYNFKKYYVSLSSDTRYTVPDFKPFSPIMRSFLGWSTSPDSSEPQYKAGDEIESIVDMTLYPVWDNSNAKRISDAQAALGIAGMILSACHYLLWHDPIALFKNIFLFLGD